MAEKQYIFQSVKNKFMEKLDDFSKILLATQSIVYMASSINGVYQINKMMLHDIHRAEIDDKFMKTSIEEKAKVLFDTVEKLKAIMEDMGNYINAVDLICPLDVRVTEAAFQIVIGGKDNVEE